MRARRNLRPGHRSPKQPFRGRRQPARAMATAPASPATPTAGQLGAPPDALALALPAALLPWYLRRRRRLPWRGDKPPYNGAPAAALPPPAALASPADRAYGTWVSEIMLQQTRVATVIPHWLRWMARWPTVAALAAASDTDVAAQWAGCLHAGAREVVDDHGDGAVPSSLPQLKALPGVSDYTAGAIAPIAFGARRRQRRPRLRTLAAVGRPRRQGARHAQGGVGSRPARRRCATVGRRVGCACVGRGAGSREGRCGGLI